MSFADKLRENFLTTTVISTEQTKTQEAKDVLYDTLSNAITGSKVTRCHAVIVSEYEDGTQTAVKLDLNHTENKQIVTTVTGQGDTSSWISLNALPIITELNITPETSDAIQVTYKAETEEK